MCIASPCAPHQGEGAGLVDSTAVVHHLRPPLAAGRVACLDVLRVWWEKRNMRPTLTGHETRKTGFPVIPFCRRVRVGPKLMMHVKRIRFPEFRLNSVCWTRRARRDARTSTGIHSISQSWELSWRRGQQCYRGAVQRRCCGRVCGGLYSRFLAGHTLIQAVARQG